MDTVFKILITILITLIVILSSDILTYRLLLVSTQNSNEGIYNPKAYDILSDRSFRKENYIVPKLKKTPFLNDPEEDDFVAELPGSCHCY